MIEPRVIVIGLGNALRGDDALGPLVAEVLRGRITDRRVVVRSEPALAPDLAEPLAAASLAIFLDAALDGPPGEVVCRSLSAGAGGMTSSVHQLDPQDLLGVTHLLYDRTPEAYLLSVRGAVFDLADGHLTDQVAAAVEPMIAKVQTLINEHLTRFTEPTQTIIWPVPENRGMNGKVESPRA